MDRDRGFLESDWKLFRKKIVLWQSNYMEQLNKEYISILSSDKSAAEKFWTVEKRIREDKRKKGVLIEMSRSQLIWNILDLLDENAIDLEDLNEFSDVLKGTIKKYLDRRNKIYK